MMRSLQRGILWCSTLLIFSCEGPSIRPLQLLVEGNGPGTLDWQVPLDRSVLLELEKLDPTRLRNQESLHRAMLQRDLWMLFDGRFDRVPEPTIRKRIAFLLRELALSSEEIRVLPDTYTEATRRFPSQFDPAHPDQPFLPADLFVPDGPWVLLGADYPLAVQHISFFDARSAFLIFVRHPDGRAATLKYIRTPHAFGLPGVDFVLLRRALLIDDRGVPTPSPMTESVQVRHGIAPGGSDPAFFKFELRRSDYGLHPIGEEEGKPPYAVSFEHSGAQVGLRHPVMDTCKLCHKGNFLGVNLSGVLVHAGPLRAVSMDREENAIARQKQNHESWKHLMELWNQR